MPTPEQIRTAVDAYVAAYRANDREAFLALWAADGSLEDPVGTPRHTGVEALGAFWDTTRQMVERIEMVPSHIVACGDEAAMTMEIRAHLPGGGGMRMPAVDILRVDDDGRLVEVRAYWDMGEAQPLG